MKNILKLSIVLTADRFALFLQRVKLKTVWQGVIFGKSINTVSIVGPTASGKTKLSVELAKHFNGEIVSADSMQIYKGMQIATAKPTKKRWMEFLII